MLFQQKVQSVGTVSEFLNSKKKMKVKKPLQAALSSTIPLVLMHDKALAHEEVIAVPVGAISDTIKSKIVHAFDPLIDLIIALSIPVAGVMIAAGSLFIMVGNKERGMDMIQKAGLGYILVQLSPLMLDLIVQIGSAV